MVMKQNGISLFSSFATVNKTSREIKEIIINNTHIK